MKSISIGGVDKHQSNQTNHLQKEEINPNNDY